MWPHLRAVPIALAVGTVLVTVGGSWALNKNAVADHTKRIETLEEIWRHDHDVIVGMERDVATLTREQRQLSSDLREFMREIRSRESE